MLTPKQEQWLQRISNTDRVNIVPFDPKAEDKFQKLKSLIQDKIGIEIPVVHRGSSMLGIAGQDEIDVYIPVVPEAFAQIQLQLGDMFGEPRAVYPLQRIRFATSIDGKKIDLFLINKLHTDWLDGVAFEEKCKSNPEILNAYSVLKEEMNGSTMQEFYRRKNEFINDVLGVVE